MEWLTLVVAHCTHQVNGVEVGACCEHLHVVFVGFVYLTALKNLQTHCAISIVGEEGASAWFAHVLHHTAHTHGAVELFSQIAHEVGIFQVLDVIVAAAEVVLHKVYHLLQSVVITASCIQRFQIVESLLLQFNEHARNHLFIVNGVGLQTVGHHIVDVLHKDDVSLDSIEIVDERPMTSRTEEQFALLIAEWGVVGVGSHGVGRRLLLRETDVVVDAISLAIAGQHLVNLGFEEFSVLFAHREMNHRLAVARSIECTLHEVLLQWGARSFWITVEEQQTLGQLTIVQSFAQQQVGHHLLVLSGGDELVYAHSLVALANMV